MDRRGFVRSAAIAGTVAALSTKTSYAANDHLQVGCIGTGGRCRKLMEALRVIPGVKITALSDVWDVHLEAGKKLAEPNAYATKDFHELLAKKEIDAVLIGAPDHWHVPMTIAACEAGKDVYVEKPLTHDLAEGEAVIAAQKKSQRVVQVGTQQRSMPHIAKARELIQAGEIGRVHKVHLTWNRNTPRSTVNKLGVDPNSVDWKKFLGNAKAQEFNEYRFRNWRWFWDFGGGIFTDLMVHWIDVAHWVLDIQSPISAASIGDFNQAEGVWETPDTVQTLLKYQGPKDSKFAAPMIQAYFEGTFSNARHGSMIAFMGTEATLTIDRGGYVITPERKSKVQPSELILGDGPRGADFYNNPDGETVHLKNWLDSIRSRKSPTAPVEAGVTAAAAAHLANQSLRSGQVAKR